MFKELSKNCLFRSCADGVHANQNTSASAVAITLQVCILFGSAKAQVYFVNVGLQLMKACSKSGTEKPTQTTYSSEPY